MTCVCLLFFVRTFFHARLYNISFFWATILSSAYLMHSRRTSFENAFQLVRGKRNQVDPNSGFKRQLTIYGDMGWILDPNHSEYRNYALGQLQTKVNFLLSSNSWPPHLIVCFFHFLLIIRCRAFCSEWWINMNESDSSTRHSTNIWVEWMKTNDWKPLESYSNAKNAECFYSMNAALDHRLHCNLL